MALDGLSRPTFASETPVPSQTVTGAGQLVLGGGYGNARSLVAQLNVTAISGTTATLTLFLEDSVDGVNWNQVQAWSAVTASGVSVQRIINFAFASQLRFRWTLTGTTPSATFRVDWTVRA